MEFIIGFFISFLIGLTGVGAGILTTPLLIVLLGLESAVAVGTALAFATVIKGYAGLLYFLKGLYDKKILFYLCIGGIPGVILGSLGVSYIGIDKNTMMIILGSLVSTTALMNLYFYSRGLKVFKLSGRNMKYLLPFLAFLIGLEVGFSSIGSGVLIELLLLSTTTMNVSLVVGTSLVFGFFASLVGGAIHFSLGNVDKNVLIGLIAGGVAGAFLALKMLKFLPQQKLRFALLIFLIFIGGMLVKRGIQG